jgi:hypothetical protein
MLHVIVFKDAFTGDPVASICHGDNVICTLNLTMDSRSEFMEQNADRRLKELGFRRTEKWERRRGMDTYEAFIRRLPKI